MGDYLDSVNNTKTKPKGKGYDKLTCFCSKSGGLEREFSIYVEI